jgi:hypothetical protein
MSSCYLLTATELAALISAGYTLNSGPHLTLGDCQVACVGSGDTHTTTCCPDNTIADSLTIEFTGCATGTGTLTYSGASDPGVSDIWYGVVVLDCYTTEVVLMCEGGAWSIIFGPEAICSGSSATFTCDPVCIEFADISGNCLSGECPACESPETLTIRIGCTYTPFTVTYDTDGTFTPDFTGNVQVEAWGAGGAGISTNTNGGGGGGAYAKLNTYAVTSGSPYTVVVATNSTEDSYFVSTGTVKAVSGATTATGSGGAGGAAGSCVGDVTYSGGDGAAYSAPNGGGGGGSATSSGNGGNASGATGGTGYFNGGDGGGDGFGGGGAGGSQDGGAGGGGSGLGGIGRVIITRIS